MAYNSLKGKKVLITCGPTWVAIDPVRVISNISSGKLGQLLAINFRKAGSNVTLLEGAVEKPIAQTGIRVKKFLYFDELFNLLKRELKATYDVVVHAAAISDYKPRHSSTQKLSSQKKQLTLKLAPTPKMIEVIKRIAPKTLLVGFKLDPTMDLGKAKRGTQKLVKTSKCDLVIANAALGKNYHAFIIDKNLNVLQQTHSREQTAQSLVKLVQRYL